MSTDQSLMNKATDPSPIKLVSDENKPSPVCPKGQEYTKNTSGLWECVSSPLENDPTFIIKKDTTGMWQCVSSHTNSVSSQEYNKKVDPITCPKGQKPNQNTTGKWECIESPADYTSYATEESTIQPKPQPVCVNGQVYTEVSKGMWECK